MHFTFPNSFEQRLSSLEGGPRTTRGREQERAWAARVDRWPRTTRGRSCLGTSVAMSQCAHGCEIPPDGPCEYQLAVLGLVLEPAIWRGRLYKERHRDYKNKTRTLAAAGRAVKGRGGRKPLERVEPQLVTEATASHPGAAHAILACRKVI